MLKSMAATYKPALQCRHASVLSSSSFPSITSSHTQHDLSQMVTPASAPFTTPSNNAFHPAYIPKKVQARLTINELKQVLSSSKRLFQHLQQEYIDKSLVRTPLELQQLIERLTNEQLKLIESLSSRHPKKKSTRDDNE
ncbi:hypothetical protein BCR42DRAFT_427510 [Absidia repens]|uniref:Uncharacterized protein n=1 Tax=Absidia repens TaxID=90262 RepID=A0A1X2HZC8_9FUNG|nr:hypothetical protein BCR42DRAFT_427510 [Absidia repens]